MDCRAKEGWMGEIPDRPGPGGMGPLPKTPLLTPPVLRVLAQPTGCKQKPPCLIPQIHVAGLLALAIPGADPCETPEQCEGALEELLPWFARATHSHRTAVPVWAPSHGQVSIIAAVSVAIGLECLCSQLAWADLLTFLSLGLRIHALGGGTRVR